MDDLVPVTQVSTSKQQKEKETLECLLDLLEPKKSCSFSI